MTHERDDPHTLPDLTEEGMDQVLSLLGYPMAAVPDCEDCGTRDTAEQIAIKLAGVLAVVQMHIAHRPEHADAILGSYHLVRDHLGHSPCPCGRQHGPDLTAGGHA